MAAYTHASQLCQFQGSGTFGRRL